MKIEIGERRPENFEALWPGQYDVFSHLDFACGIPSAMFAVTTLKENGKPNVSLGAWASFTGSGEGFYALLPGIMPHTHTYHNIRRTGQFVVNFISQTYYDGCVATIHSNADDADEVAVGGFTREDAKTVNCPRLAEAFLCLECTLEQEVPLGSGGKHPLLIGRVRHVAALPAYAHGLDEKYGAEGFMLNINEPINLETGKIQPSGVAVCNIVRTDP